MILCGSSVNTSLPWEGLNLTYTHTHNPRRESSFPRCLWEAYCDGAGDSGHHDANGLRRQDGWVAIGKAGDAVAGRAIHLLGRRLSRQRRLQLLLLLLLLDLALQLLLRVDRRGQRLHLRLEGIAFSSRNESGQLGDPFGSWKRRKPRRRNRAKAATPEVHLPTIHLTEPPCQCVSCHLNSLLGGVVQEGRIGSPGTERERGSLDRTWYTTPWGWGWEEESGHHCHICKMGTTWPYGLLSRQTHQFRTPCDTGGTNGPGCRDLHRRGLVVTETPADPPFVCGMLLLIPESEGKAEPM